MYNYNFEVQVRDKTIKCRAFTLAEYRDLIKAKADGQIKDFVPKLIKECTNTELTRAEAEVVLVKLWAHSLGNVNIFVEHKCECGQVLQVPVSLDRANCSKKKPIIQELKGFKLVLKEPKLFDDSNVIQMILKSIDHISVGDEQIKLEDLTDAEQGDFYEAITNDIITELKNKLLESTVELAVPVICDCGKNSVLHLKGLTDFMRIL